MRTKMHILKTITIYDLFNDSQEKNIDSVAADMEMINLKANIAGEVFYNKMIIGFNLSVSNYYMKTKATGQIIFLFRKETELFFKDRMLNKKITYYNVPFTA